MPTILLSEAAFAELKALAEPFVDTPESLTTRLIHEELVRRGTAVRMHEPYTPTNEEKLRVQNPISHENLAHTRLIAATVDGQEVERPKWNGLLEHVHILALRRLGSFEMLQKASNARIRQGRFEEDGFRYVPDADFSIQGVEANLAWDHLFKLARVVGIPVKVVFEWRNKPDALYPGQRGLLEWSPKRVVHIRSPRLARPEQARAYEKQVLEFSDDAHV